MQNLLAIASEVEIADESQCPIVLQVEQARKAFGAHQALQGISLEIRQGEQVALLGPNGAGKTTLVRSICGRCQLDSGRVKLFGRNANELGALHVLGVVPQDLAIYGDLTTQENLKIFGRLHGVEGRELKERVEWALEWIGLADRRHHLTKTFSGGMKRRVNIACGVMHRPKLLLLDEPTVGVDPQSRQRIFDMCDELVADGTTIVLTTHHLDEAESRCSRIIIVDHGRVVADGTIESLLAETIGNQTRLALSIEGLQAQIPDLEFDSESQRYFTYIDNPSDDIPKLLDAIRSCGGSVIDMQMHRADLSQVFLHLTGCELRE